MKDWEDQESWRDFYETYRRLIYTVARKSGLSPIEAEDTLQETVTAVARNIKSFNYDPNKGSFKGWLLQQTSWQIINQFRKRQKHLANRFDETGKTGLMEKVPDPASLEVAASLWDKEWEQNLAAVAMERVKAKVEPRTFQMFQLYVLKEWPARKVAKSLGVGATSVYVAKHRVSALLEEEVRALQKKAGARARS